jgi:NAD(P)H-flavin reductase
MRRFEGRVIELHRLSEGEAGAWISCPERWMPAPGQYLLAWNPRGEDEPLSVPLFPAAYAAEMFLAVPQGQAALLPGDLLQLAGPLGQGFHLPPGTPRLALAAFGDSLARLLPLAEQALRYNAAVAVFADCPLPPLPLSLEAHPLSSLPEGLSWASFLACDMPVELLPGLRGRLGMSEYSSLPCPGEALVTTCLPCGGAGECGVCAVPATRGYKLACKDGPVFDLEGIQW